MNFGVKRALSHAEDLRAKYERVGKAVDAELRNAFPRPPAMDSLDDEQTRVAQSCLALETESAEVNWAALKGDSPFVSTWANYKPPKTRGERSIAIGKAKCELDCPARDALAWWVAETGRELTIVKKERGDLALLELSRRDAHDFVWASVKKLPYPFRPREFVGRSAAPPAPPPRTCRRTRAAGPGTEVSSQKPRRSRGRRAG
jgi:hypothetical protein